MGNLDDGFQSRATVISFVDPATQTLEEFAIDATLTIATSLSASVTMFPVEGRQNVSDHVQFSPMKVSVSGVFSESPSQELLTLATSLSSWAILSTGQFTGLSAGFATAALAAAASASTRREISKTASWAKLLTVRSITDPGFPKRALDGLKGMFENGTLFTLRTYFNSSIYTDMIMTNLSFNQDPEIGDSLRFSFSAQKVRTVQAFKTKAGEIQMKDPAGSSAAEKGEKGPKTKKKLENDSSLIVQGVNKYIKKF